MLDYDYIIVGGGIVGLSTAIELKELRPESSILLLEAGMFPTGASTKNAGFACFGSLTEILADLERLSPTDVQNLVALRWEGLQKLRARIGDVTLDYKNYGGYELLSSSQTSAIRRMEEVNDLLRPIFKRDIYHVEKNIARFGFNLDKIEAVISNPFEGQIHSGRMMMALQQKATSLGVQIISGAGVEYFQESSDGITVSTKSMDFKCGKLALCTNAFTKKLVSDINLNPGRGVVVVTKPISDLAFKGTFHYEEGYYYFRNYQDRVIFGGGRNLDIVGEQSLTFEVRDLIKDNLLEQLKTLILPKVSFEVDYFWSGIMAFGHNKQPLLEKISENVFVGVRLGGMGVAIGSKLGHDLACQMLS